MIISQLSLILQSLINSDETPTFFGIKTYVIISGSMEPELEIGDIVVVKEEQEYEEGDIISFRQSQSVITHRISGIEEIDGEKQYKTKGDNNNAEDSGTISEDLIEGKVIKIIPYLGKIVLLLEDKITIIVILVLFYIYIAHSGAREKKKRERRRKRIIYENEND